MRAINCNCTAFQSRRSSSGTWWRLSWSKRLTIAAHYSHSFLLPEMLDITSDIWNRSNEPLSHHHLFVVLVQDSHGCAVSPSQHSFLDMVTILEVWTLLYEICINNYTDVEGPPVDRWLCGSCMWGISARGNSHNSFRYLSPWGTKHIGG